MNRKELIDCLAYNTGLNSAQAAGVVTAFIDAVIDELRLGGVVSISGFGTFTTTSRPARQERNPQTGELVLIEASLGIRFQPAATHKRAITPTEKGTIATKGSSSVRMQAAGHRRGQRYDTPLEGSVEFMRDVKAGRLAPIPSKNRQAKVAKKSKNGYDDRPSESIRTVSGGLPVLGKRQYSVKEAQGSDFHRPALCSNEVRSSVRTCSQK